jgi:hypothetical protein
VRKLNGELLQKAGASVSSTAFAWDEHDGQTQQKFEQAAKWLEKQLHYEEMVDLVRDCYAHLGRIATSEDDRYIVAQLRECGACIGLWESEETEQ